MAVSTLLQHGSIPEAGQQNKPPRLADYNTLCAPRAVRRSSVTLFLKVNVTWHRTVAVRLEAQRYSNVSARRRVLFARRREISGSC